MLLRDLYKSIVSGFTDAGIETAELDARYILEERCGVTLTDIISHGERVIDSENIDIRRYT
jgi:hypothetical protein